MSLQISSTSEEKILITIAPVTAHGNPASVENTVFTVDSGDVTVQEVEANKGYYLISGAGGLSTITVTADADLGEGVTPITDTIEYFVTAAQATSFGFTASAPEPK